MNPIAWLAPGRWLLIVGIVAAVAIGAPILKSRYDAGQQRIGYERRAAEDQAAAQAQTARMRDLARAAELRYTVAAQDRERWFVTTVKEISDAAAPLATCPLPEPVRLRLNAAAACARGDSPSACGAAGEVPDAR